MENFGFERDIKLPEIVMDLSPAEEIDEPAYLYHERSDRMNHSLLKHIKKSPKHFLYELTKEKEQEKDHFRFGRAAHLAILEPEEFRNRFLVMPNFGPLQSKTNREEKIKWLSEQDKDSVVLTEEEMSKLTEMIREISKTTGDLLKNGRAEKTILFTDPDTMIKCKCRPDLITKYEHGPLLIDFKTTRDITPGIFANDIVNYSYANQMSFYADAVSSLIGEKVDCAIVAVEKEPPFDVAVYILNEDDIEMGRQWNKWALMTYKTCFTSGKWPGKSSAPSELRLSEKTKWKQFPEFNFV